MSDIVVGIDDTDMPDSPGTNKLALHIARVFAGDYGGRLILRHQLLDDPRVPCTSKNGCASIALSSKGRGSIDELAGRIRVLMRAWCPAGSDPGLCLAERVPDEVRRFGLRCRQELVSQRDARALAETHGIHLEGLGGTEDGVIGALAAVGLSATKNDGRVIYLGSARDGDYEDGGLLRIADLYGRGVAEVRRVGAMPARFDDEDLVDVGKRLRPNFRDGKVVLFVEPVSGGPLGVSWRAVRFT
jgi:hypothetical protein